MIKQLLITALVALIVIVVARMKRARRNTLAGEASGTRKDTNVKGISASMIAGFIFAAVITLTASGVFWVRYQHANAIIEVHVTDTRSGATTVYQVRRRHMGEREFRTVDGRHVSLGASDRLERSE